jgi:hypothetical protein
LNELGTLVAKLKAEFPQYSPDELNQRPDETTVEYNHRVARIRQAVRAFDFSWRTFFLTPPTMSGDNDDAHTKLTQFVRQQHFSLKWECVVYDVKKYNYLASEVLCSTTTTDAWTYSALVVVPSRHPLKKGDRIRFLRLFAGKPGSGGPFKPRLLGASESAKNYEYLDVPAL